MSIGPKNNSTKHAVLGMLSLKPMSGYDVKQFAAGSIGYFWNESYGQIYPTLRLLEKEGLATAREERNKGGKKKNNRDGSRLRRVFHITPQGRAEVEDWLAVQPRTEIFRNELLLKLFFGYQLPPEDSARHITAFRQTLQTQLQQYREVEKQLEKDRSNHPGFPYWSMTLQFGKYRAQALLRWCDESLAQLGKDNHKNSRTQNSINRKEATL